MNKKLIDIDEIETSDPTVEYPRFKDDGSWSDKVVYEVYRGDKLEDLPVGSIEQMRDYLQSIIDSKKSIERSVQLKKNGIINE